MSAKPEPSLGQVLSLARIISAPPEKVFAAWTNPELLRRWWGPPGSVIDAVEVDLQVGGRYSIDFIHPDGQRLQVSGIYEHIQPPSRLSFTWRWTNPEMDIGESLVTIEFKHQSGQTALHLTHERLPDEAARRSHAEGWSGILASLGEFLVSA